jgi:transcriptional regulator with XRE-family HTH domain
VVNQGKFFRGLGERVKDLRKKSGYSQEDMISFGFSARHWQQIEAGRPITVSTLLRICDVFRIQMAKVVRGLEGFSPRLPNKRVLSKAGTKRGRR